MTTEQLLKKFKRQSTQVLLGKYKKFSAEEKAICLQILEQRNIDVSDLRGDAPVEFKEVNNTSVVEIAPETSLTEEEAIQVALAEDKMNEGKELIADKKTEKKATKTPKESKSSQIRMLAESGKTKAEIAKELGVRYQVVYNALKKNSNESKS